jgi:hypothetical protein
MLNLGMAARRQPLAKGVTYISLEMPEVQVFARCCCRITKLHAESVEKTPEEFDRVYNREIAKYPGALHIKTFGSGTLQISELRSYLDHLDHRGHETGLLIVDYPQIMYLKNQIWELNAGLRQGVGDVPI